MIKYCLFNYNDHTVLFREKDNAHVRGKWKDLKAKHRKLESDSVIYTQNL